MKVWIFQALPEYPLVEKVPLLLGKGDSWVVKKYRKQLGVGDKVILWQAGPEGGVYALGALARGPYWDEKQSEWRVDIQYKQLLKPPIFRRDLIKHPSLRNLSILRNARGTVFPVKDSEWLALSEISSRNIFTFYKHEENRFTNGLVSLLELSNHDRAPLTASFLRELLSLEPREEIESFRVLGNIDGTADAEFWGRGCCIRFETKIASGTLRDEQVRDHLKRLKRSPEPLKALVLLTPDDGNSDYVKQFLRKNHRVLHLEWRRVYKFLDDAVDNRRVTVFSRLVSQFLEQIHDRIFEQDFAGIIQKINFPKGKIDPFTYLKDMKRWRKGDWWDAPRKYEKLDGTGRKLLLYDGERKEKGIVAEVEIEKVEHKRGGGDFSWRNLFANKPHVFARPILLDQIRSIAGFENFGKYQKDRNAYRNITREQYRQLVGPAETPA